jgi:protein SCO1/2
MAGALRILGPAANAIQPIFITLDPERDTASLLREYAAAFHPRLIALRGTDADTTRIARAFKVFHEKRPLAHGGYLVDHTAFTFVLDPRGRYVAFLPPGTSAARIAQFLREVIETSK